MPAHQSNTEDIKDSENGLCLRDNRGPKVRDCRWRLMGMDFIAIAMLVKFKVVSICHFVLLLWSVYTSSSLTPSVFVSLSETGRSLALQGVRLPFSPPAVSSHSA